MATLIPTKGNLIQIKKTLSLSKMGYDLLDQKRNILIREMMLLVAKASALEKEMEGVYEQAYQALQRANMASGIIEEKAATVPIDHGIHIRFKSVMGVDIPQIEYRKETPKPYYGLYKTNSALDAAYASFLRVKELTVLLAEMENSVYRLGNAIIKTQRRANALKNVVIPNLQQGEKLIADTLEEKEREEFSRMKVLKHKKEEA